MKAAEPRRRLWVVAVAGLLMTANAALAADKPFAAWLDELRQEAAQRGISNATLQAALTGIELLPRVLELDRRQPELTLTFTQYLARVVPGARVERGRERLRESQALLDDIAKHYRVQPRFIVALWGVESDFGRATGDFSIVQSLVTLAYDGRRAAFFRQELLNALRIVDRGDITLRAMRGSWAGAMGQSQFMPSSFLTFAVDQDGDGRRDIWTTRADVFASTANYLAKSGWRADETWGRQVRLPPGFDPALAGLEVVKPIGQWQALGIRRTDGGDLPTRQLDSSIVLPEGLSGPAYLVYNNFRVLLKWNRSNFFAIAVGTLADRIGGD